MLVCQNDQDTLAQGNGSHQQIPLIVTLLLKERLADEVSMSYFPWIERGWRKKGFHGSCKILDCPEA